MHCVYDSFAEQMKYIGEPNYASVFATYMKHKHDAHEGNPYQYTFAGIVPWLYWQMLFEHNLHSSNVVEMRLERSYISLPEYMPEAQNQTQREIMLNNTRYWGRHVDQITIAPAIYCLLNEQHALFSTEIPAWKGARIIFAFQFIVAHKKIDKEKIE